jgi:outer membrane protein TolC
MMQAIFRNPTGRSLARPFSSLLISCAAVAAIGNLAGCTQEPEAFNPNNLQRVARAHAAENTSMEMRPLPTKLASPYLSSTQPATRPSFSPATQPGPGPRNVRRMSLRDIVRVAVAHNADVRVNSYQPAIDSNRVVEAQAAYDLKFFTNFQFANQNDLFPSSVNPLISPIAGKNTILFQDLQVQSGFRQETATGAKVELRAQTDQFFRSGPGAKGAAVKPNPFWTNEITLQVTQPLLQNFGSAANAARIAIAKNTQKSSMLDFRLSLEKNLFELEQAYWQLVQAEQDVKIREMLLNRTVETARLLSSRVGTPGTTNTEVAQANAAVEARTFDLVRARAQVADLSDVLKNKMNDPDNPVSTGDLILPADLPIDIPVHFDAAEQIQTALTYRAELSQQQIKIDSAEITIKAAKNNELPKFDLVGSVGLLGVGRDWQRATDNQGRFDFTDFTLGFQLEFPIGNREAKAITSRTRLQRMQAIAQYKVLIDQVTLEVNKSQREVETTWNEMIRGRQARIAAEEELRRLETDEKNRLDATGPGFINTKLDAQARLSDQTRREVVAIVNYNIAISALERAKGTLLRYDNVVLEEEPKPYFAPKNEY